MTPTVIRARPEAPGSHRLLAPGRHL